MRSILSLYNLRLPIYFVYMLQQVEYHPGKYINWLSRLIFEDKSIRKVMTRKTLVKTPKANALIVASYLFIILLVGGYVFAFRDLIYWPISLISILIAVPLYLAVFLWLITYFAHVVIVKPNQKKLIKEAEKIFAEHKGTKVAVLGSYGKTTVKDLLNTVLSEGKKVSATPGNMNVSVSHARYAKKLTGDEDVLIIEFGEGEPGDIKRMAGMLKPDYAVITGLAPNHLDHYSTLDAVAHDLTDIYHFVDVGNVYVNGDSSMFTKYIKDGSIIYSQSGVGEWKVASVKTEVNYLTFDLRNGKKKIDVSSRLIGRHQIATLSLAVSIAEKLGLTKNEIESGLAKTEPYAHRMQPRNINGAWIIDDTYNGNLEGVKAGLSLLGELKAKRKWYVTPGLVDQGVETENVHKQLGMKIAESQPDIVVLMNNSVTQIIKSSMEKHGFKGELRIEENPLEFYLNIEHLLAAGDIVLMQNDWTDNYN